MSIETGREQHFWDKLADRYNRRPISDPETYEKKVQLTQAFLTSEMSVLEFGCGTGSTAIQHAPYVARYLATDISPKMIAHGQHKAAEAGLTNLSFQVTSIENLSPDGENFDAILALNILPLCTNPRAVVEKVRTLLGPGGLFIQSTACLKDFGLATRLAIPVMQAFGKAPHVSFFSSEELHEMMDETGFHIVEEFHPGGNAAEFLVARRAPN